MRVQRTVAAVVLLAMAPTATGCYRYVPIDQGTTSPEPGQQVRAFLNEPDRVRLTHITAENVIQINGELVEWDDGRVILSAFWLKSTAGIEHRAVGETVALREESIRTLEAKQINIALSVALTAGVVAGLLILGSQFSSEGGGEEGQPPPPDERRGGRP